jgi:hypothetical protein
VSENAAALASGCYWHHLQQQQPASEAVDPTFQDALVDTLGKVTGVKLPQA